MLAILSAVKMLLFSLYVSGTASFPKPLTAAQERLCLAEIKKGNQEAKSQLIEHNLRLVVHIIKKYYSTLSDQEDLISIGTVGLIKAVSSFDYDKGSKFSTYASRCIENEILMYFRTKRKSAQDVYFGDPIDGDGEGNSITIGDIMAEEGNVYEALEEKLRDEHLHKLIAQHLTPREQQIITMRYGLNGSHSLTQREVSLLLGISRSYVSRLEKKALETLKDSFA